MKQPIVFVFWYSVYQEEEPSILIYMLHQIHNTNLAMGLTLTACMIKTLYTDPSAYHLIFLRPYTPLPMAIQLKSCKLSQLCMVNSAMGRVLFYILIGLLQSLSWVKWLHHLVSALAYRFKHCMVHCCSSLFHHLSSSAPILLRYLL